MGESHVKMEAAARENRQMLLIHAQRVVLPDGIMSEGPMWIATRGDRVVSVTNERPEGTFSCLQADLVTPGFVDIHTHGLGGSEELTDNWLHPEFTLRRLPARGCTSTLASVVPTDVELAGRITSALRAVAHQPGLGAVLVGIHSEGPCVQDLGALPAGETDLPMAAFVGLLDAMGDLLRVMTIAPSLEAKHNFARTRVLAERGVVVAMGHDRNPSEEDVLGALAAVAEAGVAGISDRAHVTHVFNVCGFHHRDASLVNFALLRRLPAMPQYAGLQTPTAEVICDLAHVGAPALQLMMQSRDPSEVCGITDNVMEGAPGKTGAYCGRVMEIAQCGTHVVIQGTKTLAGSSASLLDMFGNMTTLLHVSEAKAAQMLSQTPAEIANINGVGLVRTGSFADLLLFTGEDGKRTLHHTIVRGKVVYDRSVQP